MLEHSHQKGAGSLTGIYAYTENQDSKVVTVSPQEAVDRLSGMEAQAFPDGVSAIKTFFLPCRQLLQ